MQFYRLLRLVPCSQQIQLIGQLVPLFAITGFSWQLLDLYVVNGEGVGLYVTGLK